MLTPYLFKNFLMNRAIGLVYKRFINLSFSLSLVFCIPTSHAHESAGVNCSLEIASVTTLGPLSSQQERFREVVQNREKGKYPELWDVFHFRLSYHDQKALLKAYRKARDYDIAKKNVPPASDERLVEIPLEENPSELVFSADQTTLLSKYQVPLSNCSLPISAQIGKILVYHNIKLVKNILNYLRKFVNRKSSFHEDLETLLLDSFESSLPFVTHGESSNFLAFISFRLLGVAQRFVREEVFSIRIPSSQWEIYIHWNKAMDYAREKLGRTEISPEEVWKHYKEFLETRLTAKKSKEKWLRLAKTFGKKQFLRRMREIKYLFEVAEPRAVSIDTLDLSPAAEVGEPEADDGILKNRLLALLEEGNKESGLKEREKIILKLSRGLFDSKLAFELLKKEFGSKLSDEKRQRNWLTVFIPEYALRKAKNWPSTFDGNTIEKFENILAEEWPSHFSLEDNPFMKIYSILLSLTEGFNGLNTKNFKKRVENWSHGRIGYASIGAIFGFSKQRAKVLEEKAFHILSSLLREERRKEHSF